MTVTFNGRETDHEDTDTACLSGQEEDRDTGADSAYSTAGSTTTCLCADHHVDECSETHDREPCLEMGASPGIDDPSGIGTGVGFLEGGTASFSEPSLSDAQATGPNRDICTDEEPVGLTTRKGDDIEEDTDENVENHDDVPSAIKSYGVVLTATVADSSPNEEQQVSPLTQPASHPADEVDTSHAKNVPTLEDQIAEVQKMRNPDRSMSYTMERFFTADDSSSDTLSIISERTEPEDKEDDTDDERTMFPDDDSDSDGTVHDDLDSHWSDDCDDVIDVGSTTPRKLSLTDADVNDAELLMLQELKKQSEEQAVSQEDPECREDQSEATDTTPCDTDATDGEVNKVRILTTEISSQKDVETAGKEIPPLPPTHPHPQLQDETVSLGSSQEDSSTQTEEVVLISKEDEELLRELLSQREKDMPRLYRTCSEDWTQTDASLQEKEPETSGLRRSVDCGNHLEMKSVGVGSDTADSAPHTVEEGEESNQSKSQSDEAKHIQSKLDVPDAPGGKYTSSLVYVFVHNEADEEEREDVSATTCVDDDDDQANHSVSAEQHTDHLAETTRIPSPDNTDAGTCVSDPNPQMDESHEAPRSPTPDYLPEACLDLDSLPTGSTSMPLVSALTGSGSLCDDEVVSQRSDGQLSAPGSVSTEGAASYSSASTLLAAEELGGDKFLL